MDYEFRDGRLYVNRTDEEKARITGRLKKIEGQNAGMDFAVKSQDVEGAVKDMMAVLRAALRR